MADEARLQVAVDALNAELGDITPYRLTVVNPAEIKLLDDDQNARYMTRKVYEQLVANIRADRNLSSLPLLWKAEDGSLVCLSGNHRVMAARDAGISLVLALYTDQNLSRQERVAIQLSHNSLSGQDDPSKLRTLWNEINALEWKTYSGLDDGLLATFEPVKIQRVDEAALRFEEMRLLFVQPEIDHIKQVMKALGSSSHPCLVARYADFDRFFDVLLQFKESQEILNTATAFVRMTDIVAEWLGKHNGDEHESQE